MLVNCLEIFIVVSFLLLVIVLFRTCTLGGRLAWVDSVVAYFIFLQTSKATTPSTPALSPFDHNSSTAFVSSSVKNVNADVWHFPLGHFASVQIVFFT
jgi:hypothetical protein